MTWNANGILNKRNELEVFLKVQNVDICLLSETHLRKDDILAFSGYQVYHTTHPDNQPKGGSAVIIRNDLQHYEYCKIQNPEMQLTAVLITSAKQKFNVGALYCPPRFSINKDLFKSMLAELGERFILGGDYNSKNIEWGSRLTLRRGKELKEALRESGCLYHSSGKPTYWPTDVNKSPDLLDFFITKKISANFISVEDNYDFNSDHSAVILRYGVAVVKKATKPTLTNHSTNWTGFKTSLQESIDLRVPLTSIEQLEIATENFMQAIQSAAWNNTKICRQRKVSSNYPSHIMTMIQKKRKARRKWQETRDPSDKNILNNLSQQLKREIKKEKEKALHNYLQKLTDTKESNYSLWRATKKLKRPTTHSAPIKRDNGTWAKSDKEKADLFADHLAQIFSPNNTISDANIDHFDTENNLQATDIPLIRRKEVMQEIKHMKSKKAPGFDLINAEVLKNLPKKALTLLTFIMNASIKLKRVPSIWKVAEIIMLPKPGKPASDAKSYRPISLLPMLGKLFEKLLLKRIQPIIENLNIIPNHQFGFRKKHSTIDQVHRITDIIEQTLEQNQICSTVFLDVAQAFDKVWHEGLIVKLNRLLPKSYVDILASYLSNRVFRVKQDNEYSSLRDIKAGVPQGSILGPILYLLYTSDIPVTEGVSMATFADDTALLAVAEDIETSTSKLQRAVNNVSTWCNKWRIKLNEVKSTHVNYTNKRTHTIPVQINNVVIPHENNAKYLGMTLDVKLRWKDHIKIKKQELNTKYKQLYWLIGRTSNLSIYNKVLIYNQILKPVWAYGIQLWGCAKQTHIQVIQTFQNKVLRNIVKAPWYIRNSDIHRDLKIPFITDEIKKCATQHRIRLSNHVNEEASRLLDNQNFVRRLKRTKPFELE